MTFRPRNAYYLRISTNVVLPLFVYLDERHVDWMSDVVLQHVLVDLRPLIVPKLQAEKDVHFGPGTVPGNTRGTVEVHRGETYQFAYFFRKTEPHSVLFKSRYFVAAPLHPEVVTKSASPRSADWNSQRKKLRTPVSVKQSKRKRAKSKRKDNSSQSHSDEDEWSGKDSEEGIDDTGSIPRGPRPIRKQRRTLTNTCQGDDGNGVEEIGRDVAMSSFPPESLGVPVVEDGDAIARNANEQSSFSPDTADLDLPVEEEEQKLKPLLKLKYQSLPIFGHCLCVVVEPWPSLRVETIPQPVDLGTSLQRGGLGPSPPPSVITGQTVKTPLFLPEHDGELNEASSARERNLASVPLFCDAVLRVEDNYSDDELMNFSQTLNAANHMHAIATDDDDDMDGAVLFGDADEVKELF